MVKGLSNQIKEIKVLGNGTKLKHKVVGKISWSPVPGLVYIDIPKGVTQIGVLDAVTLNKGRRDGLVEGQLLSVIKTGAKVRDSLTGR